MTDQQTWEKVTGPSSGLADPSPRRDPSRSIPMNPPRTVITPLSVKRSGRPRAVLGAVPHLTRSELPRAVCFPHDDGVFAERVRTCLDGSHGDAPFPAAVQALLRETFPLAVISARTDLGGIDGARVWYAFRDGSLLPPVDGDTS